MMRFWPQTATGRMSKTNYLRAASPATWETLYFDGVFTPEHRSR